jgi:hypothetical protein
MFHIDLQNFVLDTLFVIGLIGLIGGDLTITSEFPIKNSQARIIVFIFLLPLLSSIFRFTWWHDLLPPLICIAIALIYLYWTTPSSHPKVYKFWLVAMIPALIRYSIYRLPNVWNSFVDFSTAFPLHEAMITYLPFFVFDVLLPVVTAFLVTLIIPIASQKINVFLFAVPTFLFEVHYSVLNWGMPYIYALQNPNGPYGHPTIVPFTISIIVDLFIFLMVAFMAWVGSNANARLPILKKPPNKACS